ncbi:MAG: type III secretion system inner membrane ring subunit SctD [Parashewanella sp.]
MPSKFKILWLNGPLKGRQLVLPEGNFTIGPDGDVLAVLEKQDQLDFTVDDDGMRLTTDAEVWISGKMQTEQSELLSQNEVIEVEGIAFVLGDADEELTIMSIPKHKVTGKSASHWLLLGVSIFSALLIFILLIDPVEAPQHQTTPQDWVAEQLKDNELDGIKAIWGDNGVVTFNGFCEDSETLQNFVDKVRNHGILFIEHAECTDQLVIYVKQVLAQNGFNNVSVEQNLTPGSVTISGAIHAGIQWDKTVTMLKAIPSLVSWHVINESGAQIRPLINRLRAEKIIENLMITQLNDSLVITGEVSQEIEQRVLDIAHSLEQIRKNGIKVVFQNIPVREEVNRILTSAVVSYGGNSDDPFIELSSGLRLSKGSELSNGYVVEFIDVIGIDLNQNGKIIHLPLLF